MILSQEREKERYIYIVKWEHRSGKSSVDESRRFFFFSWNRIKRRRKSRLKGRDLYQVILTSRFLT